MMLAELFATVWHFPILRKVLKQSAKIYSSCTKYGLGVFVPYCNLYTRERERERERESVCVCVVNLALCNVNKIFAEK